MTSIPRLGSQTLESSSTSPVSFPVGRLQPVIFVWGIWFLMFLFDIRFVTRNSTDLPYWEEWFWVPYFFGEKQPTPAYLWAQFGDHRIPLFHLIYFAVFSIFGLDVRPILFLNVTLFGLLAAAMLGAIRKLRGRTCYFDAFIPITLLHLGHAETFLWASTFVYNSTCFLSGMILVILASTGSRLSPRSAVLVGLCLLLLPFVFGGGLVYAACMSCGLGILGLLQLRAPEMTTRKAGVIMLAFVVVVLAIIPLYFIGYTKTPFDGWELEKIERTPLLVMKASLTFLGKSLGTGGELRYPKAALVALFAVAGSCMAVRFLRRPGEATRASLGPLFHLGSCLVVALVTGWGRSTWGPEYLSSNRYAGTAAQSLLALYFVWELCGPSQVRMLGRAVMFSLITAFLMANTVEGLAFGGRLHHAQLAFKKDMQAGLPIPQLISRHDHATFPYSHDLLGGYLALLRGAHYRDYGSLPPDPAFREVRLEGPPSEVSGLVWDGKKGKATVGSARMTFNLGGPTFVAGFRMRYSCAIPGNWQPVLKVEWHARDARGSEFWKDLSFIDRDEHEHTVTIWIYDKVDRVRITPDKHPCDFTISDVTLLLPTTEPMPFASDGGRE